MRGSAGATGATRRCGLSGRCTARSQPTGFTLRLFLRQQDRLRKEQRPHTVVLGSGDTQMSWRTWSVHICLGIVVALPVASSEGYWEAWTDRTAGA